jgi:hypothetical protein
MAYGMVALLVDNDHYKSAAGEEGSMLLVPHWEQCPGNPLPGQMLYTGLGD